jgi:CelD/BcsL family acetyltransferase involved in cellulose biosynthesis
MDELCRVLDPTVADDRDEWERIWAESSARLPYAHPGVAGALEAGRGKLLALTMTWRGASVLYPVVLREAGNGLRDVTSPYGYGGALVTGDVPSREIGERFWRFFEEWARDLHVVSEFVRLSLFPDTLEHPGRVRRRSVNYVRELTSDHEALWSASAPKVRQNARRARRSGLTVRIAEDRSLLDDFERVYADTMERLGSDSWYRFDHAFFEALHREYPGRLVYVAAEQEGRPVSIDLLLVGRDTAYYFLGGTDITAANVRPNDLVKMTVMEWLADQGYHWYVLGGGVRSGDGLERYKRGFAPSGDRYFCTAERILDPTGYAELTAERRTATLDSGLSWDEESAFFPAYRAPIPEQMPALVRQVTEGVR